ncbi:MAG: sugar ABC transporter substrate-binding protein [Loktanella sp.]|nr:sugar ABC transporter substrate-binding protein [Loktanella sp.]
MELTRRMMLASGLMALAARPGWAQGAPLQVDPNMSASITVWTWPNNDRTINALLPAFNAAYPNIRVEVQGFPNANSNYLNTVQRALLSGSGPDVAMIEINELALLAQRPQWVDLAAEPYNAGSLLADFADFTVENVTTAEGKIVALPKHTGPGALFYRRDIFDAVGLPSDPDAVADQFATWPALIEGGAQLVRPNERWMIANGIEILTARMGQAGVSWFDADGNLQLDHAVIRDGLDLVDAAAEAGLISPFVMWSPEWQSAFGNGQIATIMSGNWFGGLLKRAFAPDDAGKWGVSPIPADDTGNRAWNYGGDHIGILETSQNKEAAWAFIHWLVTDDESLKQQYQNDDLYPGYLPAGSAEWINFEDPYYAGQNVNTVFAEVQATMSPWTLNTNDRLVGETMQSAVDNIVRRVATPEQALEQAQTRLAARL